MRNFVGDGCTSLHCITCTARSGGVTYTYADSIEFVARNGALNLCAKEAGALYCRHGSCEEAVGSVQSGDSRRQQAQPVPEILKPFECGFVCFDCYYQDYLGQKYRGSHSFQEVAKERALNQCLRGLAIGCEFLSCERE